MTEGNISGVVTDGQGLPLPGVNVVISGTTIGTQTDFDGYYSLDAPIGSELIFSYIGFANYAAPIGQSGSVNVALEEDAQALEEIVVTALGVQRKKHALGYVVAYADAMSVNADIESKLAGKAAGVSITQLTGSPGDAPKIIIRGLSSVQTDKRTLFVVDGVPYAFDEGEEGEIKLAPSDIEDISVLKGSAATAIYGARGANGVVIITTKKGLEEALTVEARTNLKETAFFFPDLKTDPKGVVSFNFESPQALTRWRFMMFAHSKDLELGELEKSAITQKDISIIPNYPRFLRGKDTLMFSAKISNLTSDAQAGTAILQLFDAVSMEPLKAKVLGSKEVQHFTLSAKGDANITWELHAPEDVNAIQFKVIAKAGSKSDGETKIIPVLSNRILVTETKPIWVLPEKTKEVRFEKLENFTSQTLKHHRFTLEYTSNPAWMAVKSLPYLMEFPYECAEQTFSRFYANAIAEHVISKNPKIEEVFESWKDGGALQSPLEKNDKLKSIVIEETPWVRETKNESANKARLAKLFDKTLVIDHQAQAITKLKELQLPSGGFPWFAGGRENFFITRHIVAGFGHLERMDIESENGYRTKPIVKKAISYLDAKFLDYYQDRLTKTLEIDDMDLSHNMVHYWYTRSFYLDEFPLSEELRNISLLYVAQCEKSWLTQRLYQKTLMALTLHRLGKKETAKKIMIGLKESAVTSEENGVYWKENTPGWYWYQAPVETQALLIEAFAEIAEDQQLIDGLKLWLLKNKRTHQWNSTKATTEAIYALLLKGSDWLSVSDNTVITLGNEKIKTKKLEATQKEAGTGYLKLDWTAEEISPKMGTVKIQNKSKVSGFGGVYWQYFEDLDKIAGSGSGPLKIRKTLFLKEITNSGAQLITITNSSELKVGDLVTVKLEIDCSEELEFVHLKDLRASGLEPVDVLSEYKWQDGLGYYQTTKDVATHFFFDQLPKGSHVLEYNLRINNQGNFATGTATLQSMYAPEFSGHSKGERLKVQ